MWGVNAGSLVRDLKGHLGQVIIITLISNHDYHYPDHQHSHHQQSQLSLSWSSTQLWSWRSDNLCPPPLPLAGHRSSWSREGSQDLESSGLSNFFIYALASCGSISKQPSSGKPRYKKYRKSAKLPWHHNLIVLRKKFDKVERKSWKQIKSWEKVGKSSKDWKTNLGKKAEKRWKIWRKNSWKKFGIVFEKSWTKVKKKQERKF